MKENTRQRMAFDLYVLLGAKRSIEALHRQLLADPSAMGLKRAPSRRTLDVWSSAFHWQDRLLDLERTARKQDQQDLL